MEHIADHLIESNTESWICVCELQRSSFWIRISGIEEKLEKQMNFLSQIYAAYRCFWGSGLPMGCLSWHIHLLKRKSKGNHNITGGKEMETFMDVTQVSRKWIRFRFMSKHNLTIERSHKYRLWNGSGNLRWRLNFCGAPRRWIITSFGMNGWYKLPIVKKDVIPWNSPLDLGVINIFESTFADAINAVLRITTSPWVFRQNSFYS